jgi:hypothetical protein
MAEDIIKKKLKERFADWPTPIRWSNEPFNRIDGQEFIDISVHNADEEWAGIGTQKTVSKGYILIAIYVPLFSGTNRTGSLAELAKAKTIGWIDGGLDCRAFPPLEENGPSQPIWFARIVTQKYEYNKCYEV